MSDCNFEAGRAGKINSTRKGLFDIRIKLKSPVPTISEKKVELVRLFYPTSETPQTVLNSTSEWQWNNDDFSNLDLDYLL